MTWSMIWLNWSITTINATLQLLDIYIDIDYEQWFQDFFKLILWPPLM